MKRSGTNISAAVILSAALLAAVGGCKSEPAEPSQSTKQGSGAMKEPAGMSKPQPTGGSSMTTPPTESTKEGTGLNKTPAGMAKPSPEPVPAAADLTHVVTKDSPYFASSPTQKRAPDGTFKAGTKVLLLMPMGSYSQVQAENGVKGYVATEGLQSLK
jgi:hypothetical protein